MKDNTSFYCHVTHTSNIISFQHQDCGQTGPMLAGLLNAPQATFAANVERGDDGSITVERETDTGKSH